MKNITWKNIPDSPMSYKVGADGLYRLMDGTVWEKKDIGLHRIPQFDPKFIVANGNTVELRYGDDGHWTDIQGTVFAIIDSAAVVDHKVRCGVGWLAFPEDHLLTLACRVHDYAYSSPSYQIFKSRKTADKMLAYHIDIVAKGTVWRVMKHPFYYLTRVFGRFFWEDGKFKR